MTISIPNASQMELGILTEATLGVLPSPATFITTRVTGESLEVKRENVVSNEIRSDRNVADLIQVGGSAAGGFNFELSYGTFDEIFCSAMFSTWSGSPANNLINGITPKSFHIQKKFEGGSTDQYFLYKGMIVDTLDLSIKLKQIVTGSVSFMGLTGVLSQAATGNTSAATTKAVMNAASNLTLTKVGISPLPTVLGITLKISNKLRAQAQCASIAAAGIGSGRCEITGTFEVYFTNKAIADMYLAGNAGGLTFTIGGTSSEKYTFTIPNLKLSGVRAVAGGNDQDVVLACDFQALYDSGIAGTMQITKAVA